MEILKLSYNNGIQFNKKCANRVASTGKIEILYYMESIGIIPNKKGANYALINNHFKILDWLKKEKYYQENMDILKLVDVDDNG